MFKFILLILLLVVVNYSVHCTKPSTRNIMDENSQIYPAEYLKEIFKRSNKDHILNNNKQEKLENHFVKAIFNKKLRMEQHRTENLNILNQESKKEKRKKIPFRWG